MKLAVLLITTLIVLFGGIAAQHQLSDDACISLRYARNIAEGYGSVSQIGSQPVERYSNWLSQEIRFVQRLPGCHFMGDSFI